MKKLYLPVAAAAAILVAGCNGNGKTDTPTEQSANQTAQDAGAAASQTAQNAGASISKGAQNAGAALKGASGHVGGAVANAKTTGKVKTVLSNTKGVNANMIDVDTNNGVVTLKKAHANDAVTPAQAAAATKAAGAVEGVTKVVDQLGGAKPAAM